MRVTRVFCDRCGVEMTGKAVKIIPHYSRQDHYNTGCIGVPVYMGEIKKRDFCRGCAEEIVSFALQDKKRMEPAPDITQGKPEAGEVDWSAAVERMRANQ